MRTKEDPFQVLGLSSRVDVTVDRVKSAFRKLIFTVHADVGGAGDGEAVDRLRKARDEAIDLISNRPEGERSPFDTDLHVVTPSPYRRTDAVESPEVRTAETLSRGAHLKASVRITPETLRSGGRATAVLPCDCACCLPGVGSPVCRVCGGEGTLLVGHTRGVTSGDCPTCQGTGTTRPELASCHHDHGSAHVVVDVPPGTRDGSVLRIPERGMAGPRGRGDAVLRVDGSFSYLGRAEFAVPVSVEEMRKGTVVALHVPDVGDVQLRIAPGTGPGAILYREIYGRLHLFRIRAS